MPFGQKRGGGGGGAYIISPWNYITRNLLSEVLVVKSLFLNQRYCTNSVLEGAVKVKRPPLGGDPISPFVFFTLFYEALFWEVEFLVNPGSCHCL